MTTGLAFEGETIGSFLVRRAWERGDLPATMAHGMGLGWSIWTRDIDRSLSAGQIERISRAVGLLCGDVRAMTLSQLLQDAGIPTQRSGFQQWLTPVGIYHRKRLRYGQLFCPACFRASPSQLRMEWRLATAWVCEAHGVLLRDACANCDAPFAPFRHDALMLARCDRCMAPLQVPLEAAPAVDCALQMRVRALWQEAMVGDGQCLAEFHEALTASATRDLQFRSAGEPWSYWRVAERHELLVKVAQETLTRPVARLRLVRGGTAKKVSKAGRRRCNGLPIDPAARAEALIQLAACVKFPRRPKARIAKTA